jgi:hypothetical protein
MRSFRTLPRWTVANQRTAPNEDCLSNPSKADAKAAIFPATTSTLRTILTLLVALFIAEYYKTTASLQLENQRRGRFQLSCIGEGITRRA